MASVSSGACFATTEATLFLGSAAHRGATLVLWHSMLEALWRAVPTAVLLACPAAGDACRGDGTLGTYVQGRADYGFDANLTGALEAVHYTAGDTIRQAGGHDSDYLGVEIKFAW